jgi:hypothetical protein
MADAASEAIRQRRYIEGLRLIEEAFNTLREPLNIDEEESVERPEVQIALQLTGTRDKLSELILQRQRQGIKAA